MSLLSIVQNVAASVNTVIPTSIVGNPNADSVQWLALANLAAREVAKRHDWTTLILDGSFTSTATVEQTDVLNNIGFGHFVPDVVLWNQSLSVPLTGPVQSNEWMELINSGLSGGTGWWRRSGNDILITPAPTAGQTFAFQYVSENWGDDGDESEWNVDTDAPQVPEELIELSLTWRWLRAHGMDYAEEMATFERELEKAAARDRGLGVLVVDRHSDRFISWPGTIIP